MKGRQLLFDPGLQPERTALAWQRTILSLAVASTACVRVGGAALGVDAALLGLLSVLSVVACLYSLSRSRYRRVCRELCEENRLGRGGMGIAMAALALVVVALLAAVAVVGLAIGRAQG
ncbi:DUF202 domain-containing protein [Pseudoclavibacter sp. RFBB5]|uniref:DUF202 domain-containing protein n=1 Tax=Pseudoclavibacter sp. RFBB5 TaxID=2080574 RepID=UPI001C67A96D|nr:DUF202 domain-containing protein [Pseudoclavibacter sp. RFBB5]